MIVDTDFPDHWKTRMLVNLLGDDEAAPVYLLRLWAHCQNRKTDTFQELPAMAIKAICHYKGDADEIEQALITCRFIERNQGDLIVRGWADYNAGLLRSVENGKRGGRPKKKTQSKPSNNPEITQPKPSDNPAETDEIRGDKSRLEEGDKNSLPPNPPPGGKESENHSMTSEELAAISDQADNDATPPKPPDDCPGPEIAKCYNEMLGHRLQQVMNSTQKRRDMVREAWKYPVIGQDFENIKRLFAEVKKSKFLMGYAKGSDFKASYDWIFSDEDRIVRIMEGQFRDEKR